MAALDLEVPHLDDDNGVDDSGPDSHPPRVRVDDEAWLQFLVTKETKAGVVVVPNVSNVIIYLRYHPAWRGVLAWDAFGDHVITRRAPPWHAAVAPSVVEDGIFHETDVARVVDWLARNESLGVNAKLVEQAIPVVAEANSFHPVREYLRALEWDGTERLPTWLSTYAGAQQSAYSAAVGTRWMISAVARPMDPGCQVDCMLVLEGPQGAGKSSAFRALVPDKSLYSETGVTIGDKDSYQSLHGIWIYLLDELDSLKRGDVTKTKNFMTSVKDHYRPSYGRVARDFYRQTVFAGTTNESEYLTDRTGNRRFWPVRVVRPIDVQALVRDRDQLWAEAFDRYANGERWYADTAELRSLCEAEQADRVQGDPWEEFVGAWLADPRHRVDGDTTRASGAPFAIDADGVTTGEVLAHAIGKSGDRITKYDEMRVAEVLAALDYERGPQQRENGGRVRRYTKVVTAVTVGGDTVTTENSSAISQVSPPSPPKGTRTQGVKDMCLRLHMKTQDTISGGDGGDSNRQTFAEDMAELGIGGGK